MASRARRSDLAGRLPVRLPGRPTVNGREAQRRFWLLIAEGLSHTSLTRRGAAMSIHPRLGEVTAH